MKQAILLTLVLFNYSATAQNQSFSLRECIDYALKANSGIKNAVLDLAIQDNKTSELRSKKLPHAEANADYLYNLNIQKIILENGAIPAFTDPTVPMGEVIAFQLQLKNSLTASLNVSQVIIDKSLSQSLHTAPLYQELNRENLEKAKVDLIVAVTKAYYSVLISQQQLSFLEDNLKRIETVYAEAEARVKGGVIRPIDLNRIEVAMNNIKDEREKARQNVLLSKATLAYQMHLDHIEAINLSDSLDESLLLQAPIAENNVNYPNRPEYSILRTRQQISAVNTLMIKSAYAPRLSAFATSGFNPASTNFFNLFQSSRYYNYTFVGLRLQVPVFDGYEKKYKLSNALLEEEKLQNNLEETENLIDLQVNQAQIKYAESLESIKLQKRNLELAEETVASIKIENQQGIVNNIEVINAETDLRLAQNNYYGALYRAVMAKIDLEQASGGIK